MNVAQKRKKISKSFIFLRIHTSHPIVWLAGFLTLPHVCSCAGKHYLTFKFFLCERRDMGDKVCNSSDLYTQGGKRMAKKAARKGSSASLMYNGMEKTEHHGLLFPLMFTFSALDDMCKASESSSSCMKSKSRMTQSAFMCT